MSTNEREAWVQELLEHVVTIWPGGAPLNLEAHEWLRMTRAGYTHWVETGDVV